MRKFIFSTFILIFACAAHAATNIADIVSSMPKELIPYINDNMKAELVNSVKNGDTISINSMLEEKIAIDSITNDFIRIKATKTTTIQLRLLPVSDSTSIICMVKTLEVPIRKSKVSLFTTSWSPVDSDYGLPTFADTSDTIDTLTCKPEDMSEDKFREIVACIDPVVTYADISSADGSITFGLSISPFVTSDERREIKRIIRQKTFKWDGVSFKKC
ncbi:MAG: DUF3256 family protein [Prevotella sp.]